MRFMQERTFNCEHCGMKNTPTFPALATLLKTLKYLSISLISP